MQFYARLSKFRKSLMISTVNSTNILCCFFSENTQDAWTIFRQGFVRTPRPQPPSTHGPEIRTYFHFIIQHTHTQNNMRIRGRGTKLAVIVSWDEGEKGGALNSTNFLRSLEFEWIDSEEQKKKSRLCYDLIAFLKTFQKAPKLVISRITRARISCNVSYTLNRAKVKMKLKWDKLQVS